MLTIDFKLCAYWINNPLFKKYDVTPLVSCAQINPHEFLSWIYENNVYPQGGYTIDIDHVPYNGHYDTEVGQNDYYIDHIAGALSFLSAVNEIRENNKVQKKAIKKCIWQVDYSSMELSYFPKEDKVTIKDDAYGLKEININGVLFFEEFYRATNKFIALINQISALDNRNHDIINALGTILKK